MILSLLFASENLNFQIKPSVSSPSTLDLNQILRLFSHCISALYSAFVCRNSILFFDVFTDGQTVSLKKVKFRFKFFFLLQSILLASHLVPFLFLNLKFFHLLFSFPFVVIFFIWFSYYCSFLSSLFTFFLLSFSLSLLLLLSWFESYTILQVEKWKHIRTRNCKK